jgi:hypothetical protein
MSALVSDRELHLRQVPVEQVHVVPRDDVLRHGLPEETEGAGHRTFQCRRDSADKAADSNLSAEKSQLVVRFRKLEVVYPDHLHALRIDDLLVEQVPVEEDLIGLEVAESKVGPRCVECDLFEIERVYVLAP